MSGASPQKKGKRLSAEQQFIKAFLLAAVPIMLVASSYLAWKLLSSMEPPSPCSATFELKALPNAVRVFPTLTAAPSRKVFWRYTVQRFPDGPKRLKHLPSHGIIDGLAGGHVHLLKFSSKHCRPASHQKVLEFVPNLMYSQEDLNALTGVLVSMGEAVDELVTHSQIVAPVISDLSTNFADHAKLIRELLAGEKMNKRHKQMLDALNAIAEAIGKLEERNRNDDEPEPVPSDNGIESASKDKGNGTESMPEEEEDEAEAESEENETEAGTPPEESKGLSQYENDILGILKDINETLNGEKIAGAIGDVAAAIDRLGELLVKGALQAGHLGLKEIGRVCFEDGESVFEKCDDDCGDDDCGDGGNGKEREPHEILQGLKNGSDEKRRVPVLIEGHATPKGTANFNLKLSEQRALRVACELQPHWEVPIRVVARGESHDVAFPDAKDSRRRMARILACKDDECPDLGAVDLSKDCKKLNQGGAS